MINKDMTVQYPINMGFLDKVKVAAKNADSKAGEAIDKGKLKSKISDEEREIEKLYKEIGKLCYGIYSKDGESTQSKIDDLCKKIDNCKKKIEDLKAEIESVEEAAKKERDDYKASLENKEE